MQKRYRYLPEVNTAMDSKPVHSTQSHSWAGFFFCAHTPERPGPTCSQQTLIPGHVQPRFPQVSLKMESLNVAAAGTTGTMWCNAKLSDEKPEARLRNLPFVFPGFQRWEHIKSCDCCFIPRPPVAHVSHEDRRPISPPDSLNVVSSVPCFWWHRSAFPLQEIIKNKKEGFVLQNEEASAKYCQEKLDQLSKTLMKGISAGMFSVPGGHELYRRAKTKLEMEYCQVPRKGVKVRNKGSQGSLRTGSKVSPENERAQQQVWVMRE